MIRIKNARSLTSGISTSSRLPERSHALCT